MDNPQPSQLPDTLPRLGRWLSALLLAFASLAGHAETLAISCGAVGQELKLCQEGVDAWAKQTGHQVKVISTPNSATERLALYQQILAAHSAKIDIYQIDIVWPGILGNHFIDLAQSIDAQTIGQHFPAIIKNNTVHGALVAMPWFTDAGVLYYRKDLLAKYHLQPPTTWAALTTSARQIQESERRAGQAHMQGFVFQAKAYEGLTCNALEWIDSFGGTLIDDHGKVKVNSAATSAALKLAASWIGTISPPGILNYDEEESRGVFQSGNAVFMRNWPYAWSLANAPDSPVRGQVGVIALPQGEGAGARHSGVLGGWNLAVSRYSAHPALAVDLVRYLTSFAEQKRRAIAGAYNPTIERLYQDPEVLAAAPFFGQLYPTFAHAVARPSRLTGSKYNRVSAEFYGTVHDVLAGQRRPDDALGSLQSRLKRLSRGGRW